MAGTFSGKPYDSPCFATPCTVFNAQELFNSAGLDSIQFGRVDKKETKGLRWKYLYESAVKAWEKLEFDYDKLQGIKTKIDPERQCLSSSYAEEGDLESPAGEEHVEVPASERQSPSTNPTTPASGEPEAQGNGDKGDMEQYDERIEESDVEMDTPEGDDEEDGAQRDILEGEDDEGDAPMDISWGESA
ncbi:hypothetical protein BU26DRAFT_515156 [Trematosphaeria pertusa]|uniref:Uncharacterized protein n=1 Tax=Trematosphaeria pertusa TaxID=390896 RepID=A0A6A6IY19_9PLEO|nr:uncharacterized protein BU26DRAFT_515156 [Trematosphaeria pertusa]KAF2255441.1 hypothetical protein BU26DRAFT_515156 [Trematosphaeria pertusa]